MTNETIKGLETARKPIGIYFEWADGPTDGFGESDNSNYYPFLFQVETKKCSGLFVPICPIGTKRVQTPKNYLGYGGDFICPKECKGREVDWVMVNDKERESVIKTILGGNFKLTSEARGNLEDNLGTIEEYHQLGGSIYPGIRRYYDSKSQELAELRNKGKYEFHWTNLRNHLEDASRTGISGKYPRIAQNLKKYFDAIRVKD